MLRRVGLLLLAVAVLGCSAQHNAEEGPAAGRLFAPTQGGYTRVGAPLTVGLSRGTAITAELCIRKAKGVTVTKVAPVNPKGGFAISDFRIYKPDTNPVPLEGWTEKPLSATLAAHSSKVVSGQCDTKSDRVNYLVVEVHRTSKLLASATELLVSYRAGKSIRRVKAPFGIIVCPPTMLDDKRCGG